MSLCDVSGNFEQPSMSIWPFLSVSKYYNLTCVALKARLHNVTFFAATDAAEWSVHPFDAAVARMRVLPQQCKRASPPNFIIQIPIDQ